MKVKIILQNLTFWKHSLTEQKISFSEQLYLVFYRVTQKSTPVNLLLFDQA